eukprot:TRINITY_DN7796_c1_g1_i2.p1 TRINITY_DN7796_c1_g1~~TRINITY_DN7796_c1_g1_i2.p1  ORF type:complete len:1326 (+),score=335.84 TRINITY_DN7796_c1_g1_i2:3048-7025(+)
MRSSGCCSSSGSGLLPCLRRTSPAPAPLRRGAPTGRLPLRCRPPPSTVRPMGWPPCCAWAPTRMQVLLGHGCSLRGRDSEGRLALHIAAEHSSAGLLGGLLRRGAHGAALPGPDGLTPLRLIAAARRRPTDSPQQLREIIGLMQTCGGADVSEAAAALRAALLGWYSAGTGSSTAGGGGRLAMPPQVYCAAVAGTAAAGGGPEALSAALPLYFAAVVAARLTPAERDDGSWQYAAATTVPSPGAVPAELAPHWPPAALLALLLTDCGEDTRWALRAALQGQGEAAGGLLPALFYFPAGVRVARSAAAEAPQHPEWVSACRSAPAWDVALRHGGTAEQLLVAAASAPPGAEKGFFAAFRSGRHYGSLSLLLALLDYRPPVTPAFIREVVARGHVEHTNMLGDTLLHLAVMCDNPDAVAELDPGAVDPARRNNAGLAAADYCRSAAVLRLLQRRGGVPPVSDALAIDFCVVTDAVALERSDPISVALRSLLQCCCCFTLRGGAAKAPPDAAERVADLRRRLEEQRVIVHESPPPSQGLLALALPRRRQYEIWIERGEDYGGEGSGSSSSSDDEGPQRSDARSLLRASGACPLQQRVARHLGLPEERLRISRLRRIKLMQAALNPFISARSVPPGGGRATFDERLQIDLVKLQTKGVIASSFPVHFHAKPRTAPAENGRSALRTHPLPPHLHHLPHRPDGIHRLFRNGYPIGALGRWLCGGGCGKDEEERLIAAETYLSEFSALRGYCGEAVAFYFAFLACYQACTLLLVPVTLAQFIAQLVLGADGAPVFAAAVAALVLLWGSGFDKLWKRREAQLAAQWGAYLRPRGECPRPTFVPLPLPGRDPPFLTRRSEFDPAREEPDFPQSERRKIQLLHAGVLLLVLAVCLAEFAVYVIARLAIQRTEDCSWSDIPCLFRPRRDVRTITITPTVIAGEPAPVLPETEVAVAPYLAALSLAHTVVIMALEAAYRTLVDTLTERENYKYAVDFAQSLALKYMALQLLNALLPPLFSVFLESRIFGAEMAFTNCSVHLYTKLGTELVKGWILERIVPQLLDQIDDRYPKHGVARSSTPLCQGWSALWSIAHDRAGETYGTEPTRALFPEYAELMVQLAFVLCFTSVSPLVVPLVALNNVVELRCDLHKVLHAEPRPLPQRARSIGVWGVIPRVFTLGGLAVGAAAQFFVSESAEGQLHDGSAARRQVGYLLTLCAGLATLWVINAAFSGAPLWAQQERRRQQRLRDAGGSAAGRAAMAAAGGAAAAAGAALSLKTPSLRYRRPAAPQPPEEPRAPRAGRASLTGEALLDTDRGPVPATARHYAADAVAPARGAW